MRLTSARGMLSPAKPLGLALLLIEPLLLLWWWLDTAGTEVGSRGAAGSALRGGGGGSRSIARPGLVGSDARVLEVAPWGLCEDAAELLCACTTDDTLPRARGAARVGSKVWEP